ncbi:MAG TPA: FliA/WhiG family RNA polymerase sigma factor [Acidimicrobiales bacterium]|nr:FliA/WhiG family RNA polymerase sigma factor [Acidimicrobiales bacterium]
MDALWSEFKATGAQTVRDQLMVHYWPFVSGVASRVSKTLPRHFDEEDLTSYGVFGLMDAIERFETARDVHFESYAIPRIKGAIVDGLRAIDWVPRSVRTKARAIQQASAHLEVTLGRVPTQSEVAAELEMTAPAFHRARREVDSVRVLALDEQQRDAERTVLADSVADDSWGPTDTFEDKEAKATLAAVIEGLPERERSVVKMYYYEGLSLKAIGGVLGVSESRACQMHTKALREMRSKLADPPETLVGNIARVPARAPRAQGAPRGPGANSMCRNGDEQAPLQRLAS